MDYSGLPLINLMKMRMNFHAQRQAVLAENVANADTPGYKAKDMAEPDFEKILKQSGANPAGHTGNAGSMKRTHAGHLSGAAANTGLEQIKRKKTDELNPNGNNVSIEDEMAKVSKNQGDYLKAVNLYAKTVSLFKIAIGNPGGGG